jgi:hypothetical protein
MLARVMPGRAKISEQANESYLADVALAANFAGLLVAAGRADQALRSAEAAGAPAGELYPLAIRLDTALTEATRGAYAARRAEIGPRGYDDRLYRRQAMARPAVHAWTDEAERLLIMRESHRLTGIPAHPGKSLAVGAPGSAVLPATAS